MIIITFSFKYVCVSFIQCFTCVRHLMRTLYTFVSGSLGISVTVSSYNMMLNDDIDMETTI